MNCSSTSHTINDPAPLEKGYLHSLFSGPKQEREDGASSGVQKTLKDFIHTHKFKMVTTVINIASPQKRGLGCISLCSWSDEFLYLHDVAYQIHTQVHGPDSKLLIL